MGDKAEIQEYIDKQDCMNDEISVEYSFVKMYSLREVRKITVLKVMEDYWRKRGRAEKLKECTSRGESIATLVVDGSIINMISGDVYCAFLDFFDDENRCKVTFSFFTPFDVPEEEMRERIEDLTLSFDFDLISIRTPRNHHDPDEKFWEVNVSTPILDVSVGEFIGRLRQIAAGAASYDRSVPNVSLIMGLLRGHGPDILIGFNESEYLEFKGPAYELREGSPWKHLLCEDVARFANSEHGGVIIIGFATKKISGSDTAVKMAPVPPSGTRSQSYGQVADQYIYPLVEGLRFESFEAGKGEIFAIVVPTQRDEAKPFLVQGALSDGKHRTGMISIPRRRGEESIPVTAREIHRLISIGRRVEKGKGVIDIVNHESEK